MTYENDIQLTNWVSVSDSVTVEVNPSGAGVMDEYDFLCTFGRAADDMDRKLGLRRMVALQHDLMDFATRNGRPFNPAKAAE